MAKVKPSEGKTPALDACVEVRPVAVPDLPDAHTTWFVVGNQSFPISDYHDTKADAEWYKQQFLHALRLLPSASGRWQPISTAPKDGTTILLNVPTTHGKWNKTLPLAGWWEERDPPFSGFWIIFNADEALQRVEATHWMPLPPVDRKTP